MSLISILDSVSKIIRKFHFESLFSAFRLQFVGRGSSGEPCANQDLGTETYPWGDGWVTDLKVTNSLNKGLYNSRHPLGPAAVRGWTQVTDTKVGTARIWAAHFSEDLKIWVIGGEAGKNSYSYNGIDWTAGTDLQPGGITTFLIRSITYCESIKLFVLVGYDGSISGNEYAYYSSDGISWTLVTDTNFVGGRCVCSSENLGMFLSVGEGSFHSSYSYDGVNWETVDIGLGISVGTPIRGCIYAESDGHFMVGTGDGGDAMYAYSPDGINWSQSRISVLPSSSIQGIGYSELSKRYVVYDNSINVAYSDNKTSWALATGDYGGYPTYSKNLDIFMSAGSQSRYSIDGAKWVKGSDTGFSGTTQRNIGYSEYLGQFLIVGDSGKAAYSL